MYYRLSLTTVLATAVLAVTPTLAVEPKSFMVAGVSLDMPLQAAMDSLKRNDPGLNIRPIRTRTEDGKSSYVSGLSAEKGSGPYDDNAVVVLVTRNDSRVYQVVREVVYPKGHLVTAATLKASVLEQYGLTMPPVQVMGVQAIGVNYGTDGQLTQNSQCAVVANNSDMTYLNLNRLLNRMLLGEMHVWQGYASGCGVSFSLQGFPLSQNTPDLIDSISEQLLDQAAELADIETTRANVRAAAEQANKSGVVASQSNQPGL